jgi:hypothetical protein
VKGPVLIETGKKPDSHIVRLDKPEIVQKGQRTEVITQGNNILKLETEGPMKGGHT